MSGDAVEQSNEYEMAKIIVRRPLSSIVKIKAKIRNRDLITFKYGFNYHGYGQVLNSNR